MPNIPTTSRFQSDAIRNVLSERTYQDGKWQGDPDEVKDGKEESWRGYIIEYLTGYKEQPDVQGQLEVINDSNSSEDEKEAALAEITYALTPVPGRAAEYDFETRMIKTAALCIAALEAIYAERSRTEPGATNGS